MKNQIKTLGLLAVTVGVICSCGNDDSPKIKDLEGPTLSINYPGHGEYLESGSAMVPDILATDDLSIDSLILTITRNGQEIFSRIETEFEEAEINYTESIHLPSDLVLDMHTLTARVVDGVGNELSASVSFDVLPAVDSDKTTILVTDVPDQVSDYSGNGQIHLIGDHLGWNIGQATPLHTYVDSEGTETYYTQLSNGNAVNYKFVRGKDWDNAEETVNGEEFSRNLTPGLQVFETTIGSWSDYNPQGYIADFRSTILIEDGVVQEPDFLISAWVLNALSTDAAIVSTEYYMITGDGEDWVEGTLPIEHSNEEGTMFSTNFDISNFPPNEYRLYIKIEDALGNKALSSDYFNVLEFPCDDTGEAEVDVEKTRIMVSLGGADIGTRDMYATGKINGSHVWGTKSDDYKMTKLDDGCYYIDLTILLGDEIQFFYDEPSHGNDWWRGAASRVDYETPGVREAYFPTESSSGQTFQLHYGYWRWDPPN